MASDHYRDLIDRDLPILERGCLSKARFVSRREARRTANDLPGSNPGVKPYRCPWDTHWHLGHARRRH